MRTVQGKRVARIALAAAICAVLALLAAASASALVVHLHDGRKVSFQPLKGQTQLSASPFAVPRATGRNNLVYHGGPVMPSNTNYTLYWAPPGSPEYAPGYQSGVNKYLEDLAHDSGGTQNVDSVAEQYSDSEGHIPAYSSHFGGAFLDTHEYPVSGCVAAPKCLTKEQIEAEIQRFVEAEKLPTGLEHEYFLLTPPGVESCFEASSQACSAGTPEAVAAYCAYHSAIGAAHGTIVFANDPYVLGNEHCDSPEHPNGPSDSALLGGLSHEHNESITDPELNAWYASNGDENGDKCRTFVESSEYGTPLGKAPDGSRYNQLVNGDEYWYQQEWSNIGSTCLQRLTPPPPAITKVAPKKGPAGGGTEVTITGTGFVGISEVKFGASPASFKVLSTTSISATSPPGTVGRVDVTVTGTRGISAIVNKDHFKYTKK